MATLATVFDMTLDDPAARDLRTLVVLAHTGWLTTEQIHALCCPGNVMATTRMALRRLAAVGWIRSVRWRVSPQMHQAWSITRKGLQVLRPYQDVRLDQTICDLGRPSTALERAEWCIQAVTRQFVTQLVLTARRTAFLAHLDIRLLAWPPLPNGAGIAMPDAVVRIQWRPAVVQPPTWLPWPSLGGAAEQSITYYLYADRGMDAGNPWVSRVAEQDQPYITIIITNSEARRVFVLETIATNVTVRPVRVGTVAALVSSADRDIWLDGNGHSCSLQPRLGELPEGIC